MTAGPAGYLIGDDPARIDTGRVHRWLSTQAYWALGRELQVQRRAGGVLDVRRLPGGTRG